MSKRLLIHHSPVAARLLANNPAQSGSDTIALPDDDPLAFAHIYRWMYQNQLGILSHCTGGSVPNVAGLQDACTLLCRVFATARYLDMGPIQGLVLDELRAAFAMAREAGERTPMLPSTVMEVWEDGEDGEDGEGERELWELVLEEMCVAFSRKPVAVFAEYDECFRRIEPFRLAVGSAMTDRIVMGSEGLEDGAAVKMDAEGI